MLTTLALKESEAGAHDDRVAWAIKRACGRLKQGRRKNNSFIGLHAQPGALMASNRDNGAIKLSYVYLFLHPWV